MAASTTRGARPLVHLANSRPNRIGIRKRSRTVTPPQLRFQVADPAHADRRGPRVPDSTDSDTAIRPQPPGDRLGVTLRRVPLTLLMIALTSSACSKKPTSKDATCEAAVDHMADLFMKSREAKEAMGPSDEEQKKARDRMPALKREMVAACKEKKPSQQMLNCVLAAKDKRALDECEQQAADRPLVGR